MQEIREKMGLIIKELQSVARKEEVKVLEKYINLWNPIKFVTSNEVEQIVNDALERKTKKSQNQDNMENFKYAYTSRRIKRGVLMSLFKSKKKEDSLDTHLDMPTQFDMPQQQPQAPVEQVTMMKHQGYTNNQIIQTLQSQGYSTTQISDAIE